MAFKPGSNKKNKDQGVLPQSSKEVGKQEEVKETKVVETPSTIAISLVRQPNGWAALLVEIKDGKVVNQKVSNVDIKMIAEERFKIWVGEHIFLGIPPKQW